MAEEAIPWDDARAAMAKRLWLEGLSGTQIARRLGAVSRNAVLGKLFRMGVLSRNEAAAPALPNRSAPVALPAPPQLRLAADRPGVIALPGAKQCKYPIGDPAKPGFHFCEDLREGTQPYCVKHCEICFNGYGANGSKR